MSKFVFKTIKAVKGKQSFKQLVIVEDSVDVIELQKQIDTAESENEEIELKGVLDIYEETLESRYSSSFNRIIGNMNRVACLQSVPDTKFKEVTPNRESVKEYEYKYGDLRVFAIKIPNGQLIIWEAIKILKVPILKNLEDLRPRYYNSLNFNYEKRRIIKKQRLLD